MDDDVKLLTTHMAQKRYNLLRVEVLSSRYTQGSTCCATEKKRRRFIFDLTLTANTVASPSQRGQLNLVRLYIHRMQWQSNR